MDEKSLNQKLQIIDKQIYSLVITNVETLNIANAAIFGLDALENEIGEHCDDPIDKAHKLHKALIQKRGEWLKPVREKRTFLKNGVNAYLTEQERLREKEQRRIDEERIAAEQKERERMEKLAAKAEEKGKIKKAEEWREKAEEVYIPPAIVESTIEKTVRMDTGTVSQTRDIIITITDPAQLIKKIASGNMAANLLKINESALKKYVKSAGIKELPGCNIREIIKASYRGK